MAPDFCRFNWGTAGGVASSHGVDAPAWLRAPITHSCERAGHSSWPRKCGMTRSAKIS